jgi:hypothetical protein
MYFLQESKSYELEYSFCQTDTFDDLDQDVRRAHGVCTVCATDWLAAKAAGKQFVFSAQTVSEKARLVETCKNLDELYTLPLSSQMQLRNKRGVGFTVADGQAIATSLDTYRCAIIHISGADGSHAIAVCKVEGMYYMFDSNFGSYKAKNAKGVAEWWFKLVTQVRDGRGMYTDWATGASLLSFM